jgi:hypothetical protein
MSICKDFSHIAFTLTHIHIEQFGTLETVGSGIGGSVGERDTVGSGSRGSVGEMKIVESGTGGSVSDKMEGERERCTVVLLIE